MILRVGLTGGIASGKSTISQTFRRLGAVVIDADAIVARLYEPGAAGHAALVREYGPEVIAADGTIDRPRLSALALCDEESARRLNELIHPLVAAEEEREIAAAAAAGNREQIVVVEATLLLEAGGKSRYDVIVVVDVPPELQISRGVARGMSASEVRRRILRQMPREQRLAEADYILDNSGPPAVVTRATEEVYWKLVERLRELPERGQRSK